MFGISVFPLVGILIVYSTMTAGERNNVENVGKVEDSWDTDPDIREFDRLIRRRSDKESYPENLRMFINFPKMYRSGKWRDQTRITQSEIGISTLSSSLPGSRYDEEQEERKKSLPNRFSYVAREFYRFYLKQRVGDPKKKIGRKMFHVPEGHSPTNIEDYRGSVNFETTQLPGNTTVEILWRNIINGPTSGCPKGQRKDRNGRCRKTLW